MQTKQVEIVFRHDRDFPLRVCYENQNVTPMHSHQFTEIVIIISGRGIHETKFSKYEIIGGDVLVVPENGYHRYVETDSLVLVNLVFKHENLPIPLIDLYKLPGFNALFSISSEHFDKNRFYPKFRIEGNDFARIKRILDEMKDETINVIPGYRCCLMGYFMVLISNLSRLYTENLNKINEPSFKIGKVLSYIKSNFRQPIKLDKLIENSGMSRSTFMRKFNQATGISPVNYLIQTRINEACSLLRQSEMNISEIAFKVGFNDSNYFSRQFYKSVKLSPSQFRKKNTV
ncbi:MAG: helix-turn-helix domain-containing protein [Victivallaceae bacterium]|nr:helix-turn-helix domain-containing protein [Victivallaceae bacterium]MDD3116867.1 helix-turn-helix domain-containing protein [Victivallaceae bacterium]MDD3703236.1 helix-turn-helix domain-containing protein [Victivallaceae bacterium]MDD4317638.1 helix-turn-helix domain-containing protein [Victivallaceae bacterium]